MKQTINVTVGQTGADIVGADNRALQAAVDYVAGLGGGSVHIGPGTYLMRDSLHLRSNVHVVGSGRETVLRKADASTSPLQVDAEYGEVLVTPVSAEGFEPGCGICIQSRNSPSDIYTVASITSKSGDVLTTMSEVVV